LIHGEELCFNDEEILYSNLKNYNDDINKTFTRINIIKKNRFKI